MNESKVENIGALRDAMMEFRLDRERIIDGLNFLENQAQDEINEFLRIRSEIQDPFGMPVPQECDAAQPRR